MNKNLTIFAAAVTLPVLTVVVWLIWVFLIPAVKNEFLNRVSAYVERKFYKEKAKAGKKNWYNKNKSYGKR